MPPPTSDIDLTSIRWPGDWGCNAHLNAAYLSWRGQPSDKPYITRRHRMPFSPRMNYMMKITELSHLSANLATEWWPYSNVGSCQQDELHLWTAIWVSYDTRIYFIFVKTFSWLLMKVSLISENIQRKSNYFHRSLVFFNRIIVTSNGRSEKK